MPEIFGLLGWHRKGTPDTTEPLINYSVADRVLYDELGGAGYRIEVRYDGYKGICELLIICGSPSSLDAFSSERRQE